MRGPCTTTRSTDWDVGYKSTSSAQAGIIRKGKTTSTDRAFFRLMGDTWQLFDSRQSSILILPWAPGREVGKEGGEDAERGKERADVVHEVDARVGGKLAEKCGADAT